MAGVESVCHSSDDRLSKADWNKMRESETTIETRLARFGGLVDELLLNPGDFEIVSSRLRSIALLLASDAGKLQWTAPTKMKELLRNLRAEIPLQNDEMKLAAVIIAVFVWSETQNPEIRRFSKDILIRLEKYKDMRGGACLRIMEREESRKMSLQGLLALFFICLGLAFILFLLLNSIHKTVRDLGKNDPKIVALKFSPVIVLVSFFLKTPLAKRDVKAMKEALLQGLPQE